MSSEMSGEQMQAKIAAARRDAEGLKHKIKCKKDELADTSCKLGRNPSNSNIVNDVESLACSDIETQCANPRIL
jgi:hypothetical protein